jgi:hypothetical protein
MGIIVNDTFWYPVLNLTLVAPVKQQLKESKYQLKLTVRKADEEITSTGPSIRTWVQGVIEPIIVEIKSGPTVNPQSMPECFGFLPVHQWDTI